MFEDLSRDEWIRRLQKFPWKTPGQIRDVVLGDAQTAARLSQWREHWGWHVGMTRRDAESKREELDKLATAEALRLRAMLGAHREFADLRYIDFMSGLPKACLRRYRAELENIMRDASVPNSMFLWFEHYAMTGDDDEDLLNNAARSAYDEEAQGVDDFGVEWASYRFPLRIERCFTKAGRRAGPATAIAKALRVLMREVKGSTPHRPRKYHPDLIVAIARDVHAKLHATVTRAEFRRLVAAAVKQRISAETIDARRIEALYLGAYQAMNLDLPLVSNL
jgi:hypothetical protein